MKKHVALTIALPFALLSDSAASPTFYAPCARAKWKLRTPAVSTLWDSRFGSLRHEKSSKFAARILCCLETLYKRAKARKTQIRFRPAVMEFSQQNCDFSYKQRHRSCCAVHENFHFLKNSSKRFCSRLSSHKIHSICQSSRSARNSSSQQRGKEMKNDSRTCSFSLALLTSAGSLPLHSTSKLN